MELEKKINDLEKKLKRYQSVYFVTAFFILFGLSSWLLLIVPNIPNMSNPSMIPYVIVSLIILLCFVALILLLSLIYILKDDSKQD